MTLALIVALFAACLGIYAVYRAEDAGRRQAKLLEQLRQSQQRLAENQQTAAAGAVAQGDQLVRLEQDLRRLKDQLTTVASRETGEEAFNQAIRMARRGSSREDIMASCGLSLVEADLVLLLHREG